MRNLHLKIFLISFGFFQKKKIQTNKEKRYDYLMISIFF